MKNLNLKIKKFYCVTLIDRCSMEGGPVNTAGPVSNRIGYSSIKSKDTNINFEDIFQNEQKFKQATSSFEEREQFSYDTTSRSKNNINDIHAKNINTLPEGIAAETTPSLQKHMNELKNLYTSIQKNHPDWDQSRVVSELRKVDYGSDDGTLWAMAMPFNRGNSQLTAAEQLDFQRIRQDMIQQDDLDIGHVLVAMDVQQSFDIITDSHASWAGDLGTAVLDAYSTGNNVQLGTNSASTADLMADIDGVNIANHMKSGHEIDALFNYYLDQGENCSGVTIKDRFSTFSADHDLLDDQGKMKTDAAEILDNDINSFIYENNLINNVKGLPQGRLPRGEFIPASKIPDLIDQAAVQFIDILEQGMQQEN